MFIAECQTQINTFTNVDAEYHIAVNYFAMFSETPTEFPTQYGTNTKMYRHRIQALVPHRRYARMEIIVRPYLFLEMMGKLNLKVWRKAQLETQRFVGYDCNINFRTITTHLIS